LLPTAAISGLLLLAPAPASAAAHDPGGAAIARGRINGIVLDAGMPQLDEVERGLQLRIDGRGIVRSDRVRPPRDGELFAYIELAQVQAEAAELALILSDGRAYRRRILAPAAERPRELATSIANLVAAIEEDTVAPDARDVPLPEPLRAVVSPEVPPPPVPPTVPRREWGWSARGEVIAAAGPPSPQGLAAAGGSMAVTMRWRACATFGAGLRAAGLQRRGWGLARVRVDLTGGWTWRRPAFELAVAAGVSLEPWLLVRHGATLSLADARRKAPLLGGLVRVAPRWFRPLAHDRALVIGPVLELAGAAMPTRDGGVVRVRERVGTDVRDVFRLGGLEIIAGLELGLWLPAPRAERVMASTVRPRWRPR
jgi:hypothetical protein